MTRRFLATWATATSPAVASRRGSAAPNAASSSRPSTHASSRSMPRQGHPFRSFGEQGIVDLRRGLRIPPTGFADYQVTSPPGGDRRHDRGRLRRLPTAPTSRIRVARCVASMRSPARCAGRGTRFRRTPTAVGADTWKGDSRRSAGGANAWSVIVADPARNLVFVPTGSPNHDYYGGERARRQPVCELGRGTPRRHRRARLALPDRSSRSLGLRRRLAADPVRLAERRQDDRGRRCRVEDRPSVHPGSRDRQTADSRPGTTRAEERCAG